MYIYIYISWFFNFSAATRTEALETNMYEIANKRTHAELQCNAPHDTPG